MSAPGAGFEIALSNGYLFPNALTDDVLIHTTDAAQRIVLGIPGYNAAVTVTGTHAAVAGSITAAAYCNLLLDSVASTSTSNAPTAAALKQTYDAIITLSNSVGSSAAVTFSSNTAVAASNAVIALSNAVSSQAAVVFSSNTSAWSSNNALIKSAGGTITGDVAVTGTFSSSNILASALNFQGVRIKRQTDANYGFYPTIFPGVSNEASGALNLYSTSNTIRFSSPAATEVARFSAGNLGIGTSNPAAPLHVVGAAFLGPGLSPAAGSASTTGGPFYKQQAWDAAATTHTLAYPAYCLGDNSTGTLYIHASNKLNNIYNSKMATAIVTFIKQYQVQVYTFTVASQRSTNMTTFVIAPSGNDIVVTTDSDCSISWTAVGAY